MKTLFKILKTLSRKNYKYLLLALLGMFLTTLSQLSAPMITRKIMQMIEANSPALAKTAIILALTLLVLYLLQALGQFLRSYFTHLAAWNYVDEFRMKLFKHVQKLSMNFFHDKQTGQIFHELLRIREILKCL